MKAAFVWLRASDGAIHSVGRLTATDPEPQSGRFRAEFEYSSEWNGGVSFPLDPESLPLRTTSRRFGSDLLQPPLGVFEDALPDDWGRGLLRMALVQERRSATPIDLLLQMRGGGTGALLFTETPTPPKPLDTVQSTALSKILTAAEKFEKGALEPGAELRALLEGSSRAGGARPKALVHDGRVEWLVKFPSRARDGAHDVVGLEATCLNLARAAGLDVPNSILHRVGKRRVLMVQRFDVTPSSGRLHMLSLSSLCRERPGIYAHDYSSVAHMVRKHSAAPAADVAALFRQMVFNAAIGNVDDHLKNFWMLRSMAGYRLSPAFDLVPDISARGTHTLSFKSGAHCPNRRELLDLAGEWDVDEADDIIAAVLKAARTFDDIAQVLQVRPGKAFEGIASDIRKRLKTIGG